MKALLTRETLLCVILLLTRNGYGTLERLRTIRHYESNPGTSNSARDDYKTDVEQWEHDLFRTSFPEERAVLPPSSASSHSATALVTAREIWDQHNNETYPWLQDDACIEHPERVLQKGNLYSELAVAMTKTFRDDRLNPDIVSEIVFNDKKQTEMSDCANLLSFAPVVESALEQVNETLREELIDAREGYIEKYPENQTGLPEMSLVPSATPATQPLPRQVWNDNDNDDYPWLDEDLCIEHPDLRLNETVPYDKLAVAMTNTFNDERLTPELVSKIVINDKKREPMSDCENILDFSFKLQLATSLVDENTTSSLAWARDSFLARYPTEEFARRFWNQIGITYSYGWRDGDLCIEHPTYRSFGYSSTYFTRLAKAMTDAFNHSLLTQQLHVLIQINDEAKRPMSECGTLLDFSPVLENAAELVDSVTRQVLIEARSAFERRTGGGRNDDEYAREVWDDNEQGLYPWSDSEPCIEHPTFQSFGYLPDFYSSLAKAMTNTFLDSRLTPEVVSKILINDKAMRPMSDCGTLLDFAPVVETSTELVEEATRQELTAAREEYLGKYPDQGFARLFWQQASSRGYEWEEEDECIEHPVNLPNGTTSELFTALANAMTNAFNDLRLTAQLEALIKINDQANIPMSDCGTLLDFSPVVESFEDHVDQVIRQSLKEARENFEMRITENGAPSTGAPTQSNRPSSAVTPEPNPSATGSPSQSHIPSSVPSMTTGSSPTISINPTTSMTPLTDAPSQEPSRSSGEPNSPTRTETEAPSIGNTAPKAAQPTLSAVPSTEAPSGIPTPPTLPPVIPTQPVGAPSVGAPIELFRYSAPAFPPFAPFAAPIAPFSPVAPVSTENPSAKAPTGHLTTQPSTVAPSLGSPTSPLAAPVAPFSPVAPASTESPSTTLPTGQQTTQPNTAAPSLGSQPSPEAAPIAPVAPLSTESPSTIAASGQPTSQPNTEAPSPPFSPVVPATTGSPSTISPTDTQTQTATTAPVSTTPPTKQPAISGPTMTTSNKPSTSRTSLMAGSTEAVTIARQADRQRLGPSPPLIEYQSPEDAG